MSTGLTPLRRFFEAPLPHVNVNIPSERKASAEPNSHGFSMRDRIAAPNLHSTWTWPTQPCPTTGSRSVGYKKPNVGHTAVVRALDS